MGFPRQEYLSGLPFPSPGDLPDPGIEPMSTVSPALQADPLQISHLEAPTSKYEPSNEHRFTWIRILTPLMAIVRLELRLEDSSITDGDPLTTSHLPAQQHILELLIP